MSDSIKHQQQEHVAIIRLNNRGAEALRNGNTQSAMTCLTQALYATNAWLKSTQDQAVVVPSPSSQSSSSRYNIDELMQSPDGEISDDDMDCVNDKPASSSPFSSPYHHSSSSSPASPLHSSSSSSSSPEAAAVPLSADIAYTSPIVIPNTLLDREGEDCSELLPPPGIFLSSIIIFNLAMAYHIHAMVEVPGDVHVDRETFLKKAKLLYQLAIKSQEQQMTTNNTVFRLFFLSSVNNLGIVHRLLGDKRSAAQCFQRLLSIMMFVKYCEEGHPCICSSFFHNIFRSSERSHAPAA